jgi:putative membrane protein
MRFLVHWLSVTLALAVTDWLIAGISFTSISALVFGALVLGLVNAIIRPLLHILSLPITILTLGLFIFVVNGIAFALAAFLTPGFVVHGFLNAILGAIVVSVVSWLLGVMGLRADEKRPG